MWFQLEKKHFPIKISKTDYLYYQETEKKFDIFRSHPESCSRTCCLICSRQLNVFNLDDFDSKKRFSIAKYMMLIFTIKLIQ